MLRPQIDKDARVIPSVLIVDDEDANIELLSNLLSQMKVNIETANNAVDAIEKVKKNQYAVILMDVNMPGTGGIECVTKMRAPGINCHAPVIFVTSNMGDTKAVESGYQLGAIDYLVKPIDVERIKHKVESLLKFSVQHINLQHDFESLKDIGQHADYLLDNTDVGILSCNEDLIIDYANYTACILFGKTEKHLVGKSMKDIISPNTSEDEWQNSKFMVEVADHKCHLSADSVLQRSGGLEYHAAYSISPIEENGIFLGWVMSFHDITDQQQMQDILKNLSSYDQLTGLPNRALFENFVAKTIAEVKRKDERLGVIAIDLDDFKVVNETYGPQYGDRLLVELASRLADSLREGDFVARVDGDGFAMSVRGVEDSQDLVTIAIRIIQQISKPFAIDGHQIRLGSSIGISTFPEDGESCYTILKYAELSMYQAKESGGNQFKFFSQEMNARIVEKLEFVSDLRDATEEQSFLLHYQPQLEIPNREICGCEALIRWKHPQKGMISPGIFIPLAEQTGVINSIGKWCIEEACRQINEWDSIRKSPANFSVSVNVSANQLQNEDVIRHIQAALEKYSINPSRIHVELTETAVMVDTNLAINMLKKLRRIGIKIAIDDFGTGYSSLNYLSKLPIDILKIDQSFTQEIGKDKGNETIIRGIIHLSKGLGFDVIAEGVETKEQLDFLVSEDCTLAQGFYFYKPMEQDKFLKLVNANNQEL